MGRLPKARSSVPQKAPKRPGDDSGHLFNEEDWDNARYDSVLPQQYLHSIQPKEGTSPLEANAFDDVHVWHQTGSPSDTT